MEKTRVSTPPPQQTAPAAPTNRSKASAQAAPDDASGGAGGFLSLLSALGDAMEVSVDSPVGTAATDTTGLLPLDDAAADATDASALMAWLTSQTAQTGLQDKSLASLQADFLPPGGLVAQTARLDGAAEVRAQDGENPLPGSRRGFSRAASALSFGLAGVSTAALAAGQRSVGGDKPLASAALAATPALQAAPERRDAAVAGAGLPRTGSEFNALPAQVAQAAQAAVPTPDALARSTGDKALPAGTTEVWGSGSAGPEASPSVETGAAVAEPQQTAAEDALAEQVAFWVSENLQNAELTVTHDGKPVEVSVSMSGKEAHIVFGSDQSETRELLDASVAQLRDLLHAEGLTLSGVTVGESGARNANSDGGGDTPRGRQGGRQAQVLAPVAETGATRPSVLTDRAVDVFV